MYKDLVNTVMHRVCLVWYVDSIQSYNIYLYSIILYSTNYITDTVILNQTQRCPIRIYRKIYNEKCLFLKCLFE